MSIIAQTLEAELTKAIERAERAAHWGDALASYRWRLEAAAVRAELAEAQLRRLQIEDDIKTGHAG